jgi:ribonuclease HI
MDPSHHINTILIFTDAATSPKIGISIGAFLSLDQQEMNKYSQYSHADLLAHLTNIIIYKEYKSQKSTWSEIKTVIDALYTIQENRGCASPIEIYTDCQSLCDLVGRRKEKLEKNNYITKTGKILSNAALYKELFAITEKFQLNIFKMKGHDSASKRTTIQGKIFAILDKLSRKQLRAVV